MGAVSDDEPPHASAAMSEAVRASAADMGVGSGPGGGEAPWEKQVEVMAKLSKPGDAELMFWFMAECTNYTTNYAW